MLVSYEYNFLFIHVIKVAGSSMRNALIPYAYRPLHTKILNKIFNKTGINSFVGVSYKLGIFPPHAKARDAQRQFPKEVYNKLFKFAFVRNPWDWQISLYHYILQTPKHYQHKSVKSMKGFEEYIEWKIYNDNILQKDFVTDENGKIIVDFIGRYENLADDFNYVSKTLGLSCSLPHKNTSSHNHYKDYYNKKTIKLIEKHFKEDIELFGYDF